MNNKHIACLVIVLLCVLTAHGVSMIQKRAAEERSAAEMARLAADNAAVMLRTQREILNDITTKTSDLLTYLDAWEPHLSRIDSPEAGELNINALVKQAGIILLAQRFEAVPNKSTTAVPNAANDTIPQLVRAHLTIEDDFMKSINWVGEVESKLPTARISNLALTRGQIGNDLRIDLVVDIPLARPAAKPSPSP